MQSRSKLSGFLLTSTNYPAIVNSMSWMTLSNLLGACGIQFESGSRLPPKRHHYYFINAAGIKDYKRLPESIFALMPESKVTLFNAHNKELELSLLFNGFSGVFYADDPVDLQLKGLKQIFQGERWFKRKTMNNALNKTLNTGKTQTNNADKGQATELETLTKREKTIISLVSSGAKNQEIADTLHISPNTVKTHIYSIFKKTKSRNRVDLIKRSQHIQAIS